MKSELNLFVPETETIVKILGHSWDTKNDMLKFDFKELANYARSLPKTKRSFLRFSAHIFDPLGILSCFTMTLKNRVGFVNTGRIISR